MRHLLLSMLLAACGGTATPVESASPRPAAPPSTPLLGGHLSVRLPPGAQSVETGALSSRYRILAAGKRVVVTATELLALRDTGELEPAVRADVARWPERPESFEVKPVLGVGRLVQAQVIPAAPVPSSLADGGDSLSFVTAFYAVSTDETVQRIDVHANAAALSGAAAQVRRILATLSSGRSLERSEGISRFTVFTQGPELRIDSRGAVAAEASTGDRETYSIRRVGPLGSHGGGIEITVAAQAEPYPSRVRRVRGRLLGGPIQWRSYDTPAGPELRYTHDARRDGFTVDVRIFGPTREVVSELRARAETLELSSPCESPRQCGPGERCHASYCRGGGTAVARGIDNLDL